MIVTRIIGGLGNQMFQYAAARALALRNNTQLAIDRTAFTTYKTHRYALDFFATNVANASPDQMPHTNALRFLPAGLVGNRPRVVRERSPRYDASICALKGNIYLEGYWQSERYFIDHEATIRSDFQFRRPPSPANQTLLEQINSVCSVSLHIRRGDYVSDAQANRVHGTCSIDYYHRAIDTLGRRLQVPMTVFVFSDDHAWVDDNLRLPVPLVHVRGNTADTADEDLRLMASCRHHVIANSTFSWWGAWLDPRPDTLVVAPRQWFVSKELDASDILPERWLKL